MRNPVTYMACIAAGLPPVHATLASQIIEELEDSPMMAMIVVVYRHRQRVRGHTYVLDPEHKDRDGTYEHVTVMHPKDWFTQAMASDAVRWLWIRGRGFNTVGIPPEWFDD